MMLMITKDEYVQLYEELLEAKTSLRIAKDYLEEAQRGVYLAIDLHETFSQKSAIARDLATPKAPPKRQGDMY
jgi:hypothetical protein